MRGAIRIGTTRHSNKRINALQSQRPALTLTVVLPELIVKHRWHQVLHNGTTRQLRRALRRQPGIVITTVPTTSRLGPRLLDNSRGVEGARRHTLVGIGASGSIP